jgi:outer membrane protein OmpA-like peptidoglycan-associated protein
LRSRSALAALATVAVLAAVLLVARRDGTSELRTLRAPALTVLSGTASVDAAAPRVVAPVLRVVAPVESDRRKPLPLPDRDGDDKDGDDMDGDDDDGDDGTKPSVRRITLPGDVLFPFADAGLSDDGRDRVDDISRVLRAAGARRILIEGHTDAIGPALFNLDLSRRRALAVEQALRKLFRGRRLVIVSQGFGEARPVAPNIHPDGSDDPAGRRRNRRVVVAIER